jgi:hypothetical protein
MLAKLCGAVCVAALGGGVTVWLGAGAGTGLMAGEPVVSVGLGLGLAAVELTGGSNGSHWVGAACPGVVEYGPVEAIGRLLLEFCWLDECDEAAPTVPEFWPVWPSCKAVDVTGWVSWGSTTVAAMATMARAPSAASVGRTQDDSRLKRGWRRRSGEFGAPARPPPMLVTPVAATRKKTKIRCGRSWV